MSNPRLSGQDTTVYLTISNEPQNEITAISTFTVTWKFKTTSEGYVGETTPRKDDFFEGLSGSLEFHGESAQGLAFIQAAQARAQNRGVSIKIGVKTTLQFPDGERAIINVPNMAFGDIQMQTPNRTDYVKFTVNWEAENGRIVSR
jgi:hypothetical protein